MIDRLTKYYKAYFLHLKYKMNTITLSQPWKSSIPNPIWVSRNPHGRSSSSWDALCVHSSKSSFPECQWGKGHCPGLYRFIYIIFVYLLLCLSYIMFFPLPFPNIQFLFYLPLFLLLHLFSSYFNPIFLFAPLTPRRELSGIIWLTL